VFVILLLRQGGKSELHRMVYSVNAEPSHL
jgi:hypothetical protein